MYRNHGPELRREFGGINVIVDYVLDTTEVQIFMLSNNPFYQAVAHGHACELYKWFPSMISILGYYGHPNLIKVAFFNLMNIIHWKEKRPDILKLIGSMITMINDVLIEHTNSQLQAILTAFFPSRVSSTAIQFASLLNAYASSFWKLIQRLTYTAPPAVPSSVISDSARITFTSFDLPEPQPIESALRRRGTDGGEVSARPTETVAQACWFEVPGRGQQDILDIYRKILQRLSKFKNPSSYPANVIEILHGNKNFTRQHLAKVEAAWVCHRPWVLGRQYTDYYEYLLMYYYDNQVKADAKIRTAAALGPVRRFLHDHTLKDVLCPLLTRIVQRIEDGAIILVEDPSTNPPELNEIRKMLKDDVVNTIAGLIDCMWIDHDEQRSSEEQLDYMKEILVGEDEREEPRLVFDNEKDYSRATLDTKSLWDQAKSTMPRFLNNYWNTSFERVTKQN